MENDHVLYNNNPISVHQIKEVAVNLYPDHVWSTGWVPNEDAYLIWCSRRYGDMHIAKTVYISGVNLNGTLDLGDLLKKLIEAS